MSQTVLRQLPPGALPPLIIKLQRLERAHSANRIGQGLSEHQLNDLGQNFLRPQLVRIPGANTPGTRSTHGELREKVVISHREGELHAAPKCRIRRLEFIVAQ